MADRSASVHLSADVAAYIAGMREAAAATKSLAAEAKAAGASGAKMATTTGKMGSSAKSAGAAMAGTATATRTMGREAGLAASSFAQQDAATRRVQLAQQRLAETRSRYSAGTSQVMAAEDRLARAQQAASVAAGTAGTRVSAAGAAASRASGAFSKAGGAVAGMGRSFMGSYLAMGGAAAAIIAPVKASMDLESAMSRVKATGAVTASQLDALKTASMGMASTFGMSATQSMGAVEQLLKAGVSAQDIIGGGLSGALSLAAAGEMDVGEAAETAASAMTQFGLSGKDVGTVADTLAAGANKAQGGVSDLAQALSQVGTVAAGAGLDLQDTVGALAEFANAGIIGSDAGTSLKSMLQQIQNPTKESSQLMAKLGLDFYDAKGNFVGLEGVAGQLQTRLKGLTQEQRNQALSQIFGADAVRTASVLYKDGAKGVKEWRDNVNGSGAAMRTASANMDNLNGDLAKFKAAWANAFANIGSDSQSPLRGIVQDLTNLAGVVERNQSTVATLAKIAGAVVAIGIAAAGVSKVAGFLKLLSGFRAGSTAASIAGIGGAIEGVGSSAGTAGGKVGGFKSAMSGLGLSIPGLIVQLGALAVAWGAYHDAQWAAQMDKSTGTSTQWAKQMAAGYYDLDASMRKINDGGIGPTRQSIVSLDDALGHATGNTNAFNKVVDRLGEKMGNSSTLSAQSKREFSKFDVALGQLATSGNWQSLTYNWQQVATAAQASNIPMSQVMKLFPQVQKSMGAVAAQMGVTGLSTKDYEQWMGGKLPDAVNRAALANGKLAKSLGIIPDKTKKELSVEVKSGTKKQVEALNKEILKVPANRQSAVALTAKTKGFDAAMKQAKDFEKQAAGLQAMTSKGIKLEVKGGKAGQAKALADQIKGMSKGAQAEVAVTAKTKGFDEAAAKVRQLKQGVGTVTEAGVHIRVTGATQEDLNRLRDDLNGIPKNVQASIATTANTKGLDAARQQLSQYLAATQGQHTVSMTMSVVDHGAVKIMKDVQVATSNINGVEVKIPVTDPGAVGALTALDGINYRVTSLGGAKVLVPTSAPGAALAGQQIQQVTGKWQAINGKQIMIATSAPGAVGTKAQIDGVHGSWQRINGKVVFVATKAPGAISARDQVNQLNAAANKTNGKHVQVTAHANTSGAESALNHTARDRSSTVTQRVNTIYTVTKISRGGNAAGMSAYANGGIREAHNAQIARAGEWRVWAEPETGGEAYIPLAASKRPRSRMIAAQTVARLGGDVSWHATGSLDGALASSASRTIVVKMAAADGSFADLSKALAAQTKAQQAATRAGNAWSRARGKNRAKAGEAYNKAKDDLKTATDNAQQAIDAFAQSASQAASTMSADFRKGGSAADLMANMREGTNQLALFESQLSRLRSMGLSQSAIDSITAMGVGQGSAVAGEIVSGGKGMVDSLNLAAYRLDQIADKLGRSSLAKFGSGGTVTSPTLAIVGEAGAETMVPHTGPMAVQRWYEAGQAIGATASMSPHVTVNVAAPSVVIDRLTLDVPGIGTAIDARVRSIQTSTARTVARRSR